MTETPLPSVYTYGRVIGRIITAVGDLTSAGDVYPDAVPVSSIGGVTFIPAVGSQTVTTVSPSTLVQHRSIVCDLDVNGNLSLNGQIGVWLYTGVWAVSFSGEIGVTAFQIEVTVAHTISAPLDLFSVAPYIPVTGTAVTTLVVPASPSNGRVLMWNAAVGGLVWTDWAAAPPTWWTGTQAQYNALGTYSTATLYLVTP